MMNFMCLLSPGCVQSIIAKLWLNLSLIVIICNVADSIDCMTIVLSPSEIKPFGWKLYFKKVEKQFKLGGKHY